MRLVATAPGRAGIIGNPTDGYGGCVLSCSLGERARVEIDDGAEALELTIGEKSIVLAEPRDFRLADDRFDCVRAVLQYLRLTDLKARIAIATEIPVQGGLAGSTAILAALVAAIFRLTGRAPGRHHFAETIRTIELNFLKVQCGYQDQYMAVFGGLNFMDFRGKEHYRDLRSELYATVEPLAGHVSELPFVLAHTGVKRVSGSVLKPIRERWLEGDADVREGYSEIAHLAQLGKRALIDGDWPTLGRLMNRNHAIQQRLGASGEANDRLIDAANRAGALGAKLAGAGGGGTIIALTQEPTKAIEALESEGSARILRLEPGEGARVDVEELGS